MTEFKKFIDAETDKTHLVAVRGPRARNAGGFVMVWQDALLAALARGGTCGDLTALQWRVWAFLLASADYRNTVRLYIKDVAEALQHDRSDVGRALEALQVNGLIRVTEKRRGRSREYLLNPELVFKGLPMQRREARKVWSNAAPAA